MVLQGKRVKELIQLLHKFGLAISYNDTIDLEYTWVYHETKLVKFVQKN